MFKSNETIINEAKSKTLKGLFMQPLGSVQAYPILLMVQAFYLMGMFATPFLNLKTGTIIGPKEIPLTVPGAILDVIMFYLLVSVIQEFWGRKTALLTAWMAIPGRILLWLMLAKFLLALPPSKQFLALPYAQSYDIMVNDIIRFAWGSYLLSLVSQYADTYIYGKLKQWAKYTLSFRFVVARALLSDFGGICITTPIAMFLTFAGKFPTVFLLKMIVSSIIIQFLLSLLGMPIFIIIVKVLQALGLKSYEEQVTLVSSVSMAPAQKAAAEA